MAFDGLARIGQIALHVGDVAEATAFYRDVLGMRFLFEAPGLVFFDCDGQRLMLGEPESEPEPDEGASGAGAGAGAAAPEPPPAEDAGTILYFDVPDIGAAHRALAERGVTFLEEPGKVAELESTALWLAFFQDPWGNVLALMSETPR